VPTDKVPHLASSRDQQSVHLCGWIYCKHIKIGEHEGKGIINYSLV